MGAVIAATEPPASLWADAYNVAEPPPVERLLETYRGVTFYAAPFTSIREEGKPLFLAHWLEAETHEAPLAIQWDMFRQLELAERVVCVLARLERSQRLIGYAVYLLAPHLHNGELIAESDAFYIGKLYRHGWIGVKLLRIAESLLREKGVVEIHNRFRVHVKPGRGGRTLESFFRHTLRYAPLETVMRKRIR